MTKTELIAAIADKAGISKAESTKAVASLIEIITKTLKKGGKVQITGFGSFLVRSRKAREGRNPRTGAKIKIAGRKTPAFSAGKSLKDSLN